MREKKKGLTSDKSVMASKHAPPIKKDETKRNRMIPRKNILHHWETSHSSPEIHGIFHVLPYAQHVLATFSIWKILIKWWMMLLHLVKPIIKKYPRQKKTVLLLIHVLNFFYSKDLSVNFLYTKKKNAKIPPPKNVSFVFSG
jgi:hypothetical protein